MKRFTSWIFLEAGCCLKRETSGGGAQKISSSSPTPFPLRRESASGRQRRWPWRRREATWAFLSPSARASLVGGLIVISSTRQVLSWRRAATAPAASPLASPAGRHQPAAEYYVVIILYTECEILRKKRSIKNARGEMESRRCVPGVRL